MGSGPFSITGKENSLKNNTCDQKFAVKKFALVLAGGSGTRMGGELPKQFVQVAGKPILMHTLEKFYSFDPSIELVLVLSEAYINFWMELCKENSFSINHTIAKGGPERFFSVQNGLEKIEGDGIVFIHDGVRPLVSHTTLQNCFDLACLKGNALPVISVSESVRYDNGLSNQPMDRSRIKLVQTPQTFRVSLIKEAYRQSFRDEFTDDASVLGYAGYEIFLTEGNRENIKITWPSDILWAEALLSQQ